MFEMMKQKFNSEDKNEKKMKNEKKSSKKIFILHLANTIES